MSLSSPTFDLLLPLQKDSFFHGLNVSSVRVTNLGLYPLVFDSSFHLARPLQAVETRFFNTGTRVLPTL